MRLHKDAFERDAKSGIWKPSRRGLLKGIVAGALAISSGQAQAGFLLNPFSVVPSITGHIYWRILAISNHGDGSRIGTAEIEMRATAGGSDQCSGGTATASSTGVGSASNCFDNDYTTTFWASNTNANEWVRYQFATAVDVQQVLITGYASGSLSRTMRSCKCQWSDDGSTWTDAFTFSFEAPLPLQQRLFPSTDGAGTHRLWRIFYTDVNGGTRSVFGQIQLRATIGGSDLTTAIASGDGDANGRAFSSSVFAGSAQGPFDNSTGFLTATNPTNEYVAFVLPSSSAVVEISLSHPSGQLTDRMGKNIKLDYSDDTGASWTNSKSWTQTGWSNGETRVLS